METFPMVVLEAMSHAKPVVATSVGGIKEMVQDRETGVLVPPRDAAALAAGIKFYLDSWDEAVEIGERAQQTVRDKFSLADQARKFEEIYKSLARTGHGSLDDAWSLEDIKGLFLAHMTAESEKIVRLEDRFESAMNQQREEIHQQRENLDRRITQSEKLNSEEHENIIRDLRALEAYKMKIENLQFHYPRGSSVIAEELKAQVELTSVTIENMNMSARRAGKRVHIDIIGHADAIGSEQVNLAVSQQRADRILTAVDSPMLTHTTMAAHGIGTQMSQGDNSSDHDRTSNRRVSFDVRVTDIFP